MAGRSCVSSSIPRERSYESRPQPRHRRVRGEDAKGEANMKATTAIFCLTIAACSTTTQQARRSVDPLPLIKDRCESYGYQRDTAAFSDCVRQLDAKVQELR